MADGRATGVGRAIGRGRAARAANRYAALDVSRTTRATEDSRRVGRIIRAIRIIPRATESERRD